MSTLAPHAKKIVKHLLGEPNKDLSSKSTWRWRSKGSLAIEVEGDDAGSWFDHEAKVGGGLVDLIEREKGFSNGEASSWLKDELGIETESKWTTTGTWVYRDRGGRPLYRVVRRDCAGKPKRIHQERYDEDKKVFVGGKGCMHGVRLVPYRLNEWVDQDGLILIAEGEKKVDALVKLRWLATCNLGGSGKFSRGFAPYPLLDAAVRLGRARAHPARVDRVDQHVSVLQLLGEDPGHGVDADPGQAVARRPAAHFRELAHGAGDVDHPPVAPLPHHRDQALRQGQGPRIPAQTGHSGVTCVRDAPHPAEGVPGGSQDRG
jgi:hypothetical protein